MPVRSCVTQTNYVALAVCCMCRSYCGVDCELETPQNWRYSLTIHVRGLVLMDLVLWPSTR